jgi:hypothetical protein
MKEKAKKNNKDSTRRRLVAEATVLEYDSVRLQI